MVIPRTWIRKEVVLYSCKQTKRRMGQSRRADDVKIRRKRTPSLPIHESIFQRSAQKATVVKNYQYTSVPMEIPIESVFRTIFLSISSESTEQSQICVMNTEFAKQERGDLCWQNNLTIF